MEGSQFDGIARTMVAAISRRRTLSGLLGATLALLGRTQPDDSLAANGACRPKCGACQRCQKGRCRQTPRGKKCKRGKCRPRPNGAECGPRKVCLGGVCRPRCGDGVPCFVFLTSSTHTGNLGGLGGADAICQRLADQAKVPGIYKAWLSDGPGATPNTRFRTSTGPYVLVTGTPISSSYADLTSGSIDARINVMETRAIDGGATVWTNTQPNGAAGGAFAFASCGEWDDATPTTIGNAGSSSQTGAGWTAFDALNCNVARRLYCVQQA